MGLLVRALCWFGIHDAWIEMDTGRWRCDRCSKSGRGAS
jgi:hypothetical protein